MMKEILTDISKINNTEDLIKFSEKKPYQEFQMGQFSNYISFKNSHKRELFYLSNIIISMDGKIMMECYSRILSFLEKVIKDRYKEHDLSKTLKIMIG